MKAFIIFDAHADSYQVSGRIPELKSIDGVKSVEALERVAGEVPRYLLAFEIDDDKAQAAGEKLKSVLNQYSSYMSRVAWGAYRKIG